MVDKMRNISGKIKHLFIAMDEITGDESGVEFLTGITKILRRYGISDRQYGFNTKIIVADASIVDPDVIQNSIYQKPQPNPTKSLLEKLIITTHLYQYSHSLLTT